MYPTEDVLEAARVIRLYLHDLSGVEVETFDRTLVDLLNRAESGEVVDNQILELLADNDATREWTRQFLADKIPPPVMQNYDPLVGSVSPIYANAFVCTVKGCHCVWHRPKAGIEPPPCPKHKVRLIPAQPKEN